MTAGAGLNPPPMPAYLPQMSDAPHLRPAAPPARPPATRPGARPINPILKFALEIGPLMVFFLSFRYGKMMLEHPSVGEALAVITGSGAPAETAPVLLATAAFMVAIGVSLAVSWWLTRTVPRMAVVTAVVVIIFGGLTLWLQDATFIKMKPTIVNALFAAILGVGLLQGRSYLSYLMGEAIPLTRHGWMVFTRNWALFFFACAVINEIVWRTQTTDTWVTFKTFVYLPLTFLFVGLHVPFLQRHSPEADETPAETPGE